MWQILLRQLLTQLGFSVENRQQNGGIRLAHHTRWSGGQPYGEKDHIQSLSISEKLSIIRLVCLSLMLTPLATCGRFLKHFLLYLRLLLRAFQTVRFGNMFSRPTRQMQPIETMRPIPQEVETLRALLAKVEARLHGRRSN